jgi:hypothetical protein
MPPTTPSRTGASIPLTASEREWIRRQGVSARVQEAERRNLQQRLAAAQAELSRLHEQPKRGARRSSARP